VSDMRHVLAQWIKWYVSKYNHFSDASDGMAFTTTSGNLPMKGKNTKHITC